MSFLPRLVTGLLPAVSLMAVGCGGESALPPPGSTTTTPMTTASTSTTTTTTTEAPDPRRGRPFAVTTTQLTLVDDSRVTPESPGGPESAGRTLEVWLTLPRAGEPRPLIVFSHGMGGHPRKFEALHKTWAEAGYAIAAPVFPLSNDGAEGSFTNSFDVVNQPGDVSFVLDELLALSADESSELAGRFDPTRVGASGLSAGGLTTYQVAVNDAVRDERFSAAIVLAGSFNREPGEFLATPDLPVLVMQGDADPLISVEVAEAAYDSLSSPRYLVILHGGGHAGPFEDADDGFEPKVDGHDGLIGASTIAFWDRYLLDIEEAGDELLAAAAGDGLTTVRSDVN